MHITSLDKVQPGMILGKSILSAEGTVLLAAGVKLTPRYIRRLKNLGISTVYIWDEQTADLDFRGPLRDETRLRAASTVRQVMTEIETGLERTMVVADKLSQISSIVDEILNDLLNSNKLIFDFFEIKAADDYTFFHSVNVCALSLILGMRLGLPKEKLKELGAGSLLHDIGKIHIPTEIIAKPGPLTTSEWELMQQHTSLGFEILRRSNEVSLPAAHISYQHHERYNGSGYPRKLRGEEIHPYARITAVCDVFDALTSDRSYRCRFLPHEALEYILGGSNTHFDFRVVKEFIRCVAMYPLGTRVRLSDGSEGIVIQIPPQAPQRPVLRILKDRAGRTLKYPYDLSLLEHPRLIITAVLDQ
ncbi:MAG: HD-GYP domain-containing protein [bacterium]|jgi:HD-GYP domain-containing protein (c-di-GMP phosphodiesterase class II)|nr:HD-GYP domain-containing protein [Bacillota bacterium]HHW55666.1 HD-GYP domain-containing protein [Bacillota bacterium]